MARIYLAQSVENSTSERAHLVIQLGLLRVNFLQVIIYNLVCSTSTAAPAYIYICYFEDLIVYIPVLTVPLNPDPPHRKTVMQQP